MARRLAVLVLVAACDAPPPDILSTTVPRDTRDVLGPYTVQMVVRDVAADDEVLITGAVDGAGPFDQTARERDDREDLYHAEIPGEPRGSHVTFHSSIRRDGVEVARDPAGERDEYSFTILGLDACRADTDCGTEEICSGDRCVRYGGACVAGECPDGYVCGAEDACLILVLACGSDEGCPSAQECDLARQECRPRRPCSVTLPCPEGQECRPEYGLCFPRG